MTVRSPPIRRQKWRLIASPSPVPFPAAFDGGPLESALGAMPLIPLEDGVRRTIGTYRAALDDGRLGDAYLDRVLA